MIGVLLEGGPLNGKVAPSSYFRNGVAHIAYHPPHNKPISFKNIECPVASDIETRTAVYQMKNDEDSTARFVL